MYLVALDPTVGREIQKTRPAVVVQADLFNRAGETTIVAPVSSNVRPPLHGTRILVPAREGGLAVDSVVLTRQLRTVDRARLIRRLGAVRRDTMRRVDRGLAITLGLVEL